MHVNVSAYRKANPVFIEDMVRWNICVIPERQTFFYKNIKIPMPYFHKILSDYFEDSEIDAYEKNY